MDTQQKIVFVVHHLTLHGEDQEDVKLIGIYRTYELAHAAVERLKSKPGFCNHPRLLDPFIDEEEKGFYIDEKVLDKDYWEEGYVTKYY